KHPPPLHTPPLTKERDGIRFDPVLSKPFGKQSWSFTLQNLREGTPSTCIPWPPSSEQARQEFRTRCIGQGNAVGRKERPLQPHGPHTKCMTTWGRAHTWFPKCHRASSRDPVQAA